jgi:hypothetical protein
MTRLSHSGTYISGANLPVYAAFLLAIRFLFLSASPPSYSVSVSSEYKIKKQNKNMEISSDLD